jgi:hypothetical protein
VWGRVGVHIGFWWGNLKEIGHLEGLVVGGWIILKRDIQKIRQGKD